MKAALALILTSTLLAAQESPPPQPPAALHKAVKEYWTGLAGGDKARALKHVHPETLNAFLKRSEPALQDWSVEAYESLGDQRFRVTTTFAAHTVGGRSAPHKIRETWQLTREGWKVRVLSLEEQRQLAMRAMQPAAGMPAELQVLPEILKIRSGGDQPGVIVIRNGLEQEVELVDLKFDDGSSLQAKPLESKLFPARTTSRIALYWTGQAPPQQSGAAAGQEIILVLKAGEETCRYVIPYEINPPDPLLDWIKRQKPPARPPQQQR